MEIHGKVEPLALSINGLIALPAIQNKKQLVTSDDPFFSITQQTLSIYSAGPIFPNIYYCFWFSLPWLGPSWPAICPLVAYTKLPDSLPKCSTIARLPLAQKY